MLPSAVPIPSPFHERIAPLVTSFQWKQWAGYYAVRSFEMSHEREYVAFRHSAGLIDVTALYKYEVVGPDAARFLSRVMVKDITKLSVGRVTYLCWCDDDGWVLDDGTVTRLDDDRYRVTAAEPSYTWLLHLSRGYDVEIEDVSKSLGALALQGPTSRAILDEATGGAVEKLRFFRATSATIGDAKVDITRTGYTGDLGYEIWVSAADALHVWDALMEVGRAHRIAPAGLDALDVTRVEAGFIMNGVDYFSSNHCLIDARKSTPDELGLGWCVDLDRDPFIGQAAIHRERERGSTWAVAGLVYDWTEFEALFAAHGLPPQTPPGAWRTATPIYREGRQIGQVTSGAWSPTLKKLLGIATLEAQYAELGTLVDVEVTAEYSRKQVRAEVVKTPFFNPPRKRA